MLKKRIPLILATILSVSVIVVAFNHEKLFGAPKGDADGNLLENNDWISTLRVIPQSDASQETLAAQRGLIGENLSTTDRTGREMFLEYILAQSQATEGGLSTTSAETIARHLVEKAFDERVTPYAKEDILLAPDTQTALAAYLGQLGALITTFNKTHPMNELQTIRKTLENNDPAELTSISDRITAYANLEKKLLLLKVPPTDAELHLRFIQAYANIRLSLESVTFLFTDRVRGMVGIAQYQQDLASLEQIANEFKTIPLPKAK